jgi:c-di-GMP-binding flagellar brake protein YcgR
MFMMSREKRRASRIKEKDRITIEVFSESEELPAKKIYYVLSKDISAFGVRIQTDTFFPVNSSLKLKIFLENPQGFIGMHGKVRWVECDYEYESYKIGIEFDDTSSKSIALLEEYLKKVDQ